MATDSVKVLDESNYDMDISNKLIENWITPKHINPLKQIDDDQLSSISDHNSKIKRLEIIEKRIDEKLKVLELKEKDLEEKLNMLTLKETSQTKFHTIDLKKEDNLKIKTSSGTQNRESRNNHLRTLNISSNGNHQLKDYDNKILYSTSPSINDDNNFQLYDETLRMGEKSTYLMELPRNNSTILRNGNKNAQSYHRNYSHSTPNFTNHENISKIPIDHQIQNCNNYRVVYKIDPFQGNESFESYLIRFEAMLSINMTPTSLYTATLILHLEGLPAEKVQAHYNIKSCYNDIVDLLLDQFRGYDKIESAKQELQSICYLRMENFIETARKIERLVDIAYIKDTNMDRLLRKRKYLADLIKSPYVANAVEYQSNGESYETTIWKARNMLDRETNNFSKSKIISSRREKCIHCNYSNHRSEECHKQFPQLKKNLKENKQKYFKETNAIAESNNLTAKESKNITTELPIINIQLNKSQKIKALLDTGSTQTLIPIVLAKELNITFDASKFITLQTLSSSKPIIVYKTKYPVNFKFDKQSLTKNVYVTDVNFKQKPYQCLIGWDLLQQLKVYGNFIKSIKSKNESNVLVKNAMSNENQEINILFKEFKDVFASSEFDLGQGSLVCNEIQLKTNSTFNKPIHYPIPEAYMAQFKHYIDELEKAKIIVKKDTTFLHPCIVLQKDHNRVRMISDMRSINNMVVPIYHAAPSFREIIGRLSSSKYFTKLDSPNAFFQISVPPESVKYLGIRTPFGNYCYNRMPQGFLNSSSEYQRLCEKMLTGVEGVINYIDDIVVFGGSSIQDHLLRVKKVLECFRNYGMKISFDKSTFCGTTIQYLGYIITSTGSAPAPSNIAKFMSRKQPTSKGELKSLLASSNYFRQHIMSYAQITLPLENALLEKYTRLKWTPEMTMSYEKLLSAMRENNFMRHPNFNKPFNLITDASKYSIGALVTQFGDDGKEYLISTYSKRFRPGKAEQSATWRELVGVVRSFKHYRTWFAGNLVNIKTDHGPLIGIFNHTDDSRYISQISQMSSFHFNISHLKGADNPADYISRFVEPPTSHSFTPPTQHTVETFHKPNLDITNHDSDSIATDSCLESSDNESSSTPLHLHETNAINSSTSQKRKRGRPKKVNSSPDSPPVKKRGRPVKNKPNFNNNSNDIIQIDAHNPTIPNSTLPSTESTLKRSRGRPSKSKPNTTDEIFDNHYVSLENFNNFSQQIESTSPDLNLQEILEVSHSNGHPGLEKMLELIQLRLPNIENLRGKIAKFLSKCLHCKLRNAAMKRIPPPEAIDQYDCPGQCYSMDIMGKIKPASDNGDCYIVSVIDNYSRSLTLFSLQKYDAESLIPALNKKVFMIRGYPKVIKTDNAPNFVCSKFKSFLKNLNIIFINSTPYHSRGNSQCERSFKTVSNIISKICQKIPTKWADTLEMVQFYINSTLSKSTGVSPFFLEHLREPNTLLDQMLKTYSVGLYDVSKNIFDIYSAAAIIREEVYQCMRETRLQENGKLPYKPVLSFQEGECFYIKQNNGESNKFGYKYSGPHSVVKDCGNFLVYKIGNVERTVHKQNVKKDYSKEPEDL
ncbi:Reverse transcriptase domain and Integrase, catalytic core domain and Ribonuclease H-like domain and Peptidase A2A, retrovirus RVP subgroup domain and AT hook-like family and Aspartic peptidase domain-containing protein [Strongyloides ratti]|uniref:RNA-directed DNA polymerase n=1 Tax=Strongyloides ratti TaxID=34506 RepID=A0A090L2D9_STRRB|nr:Reverse transcriptase domain and Integrase, catalytic core domain and Ribonuclease H-like domain and Peptidase A2A, retrovirus RVP subgroup domain and AT hook-like family and Aspartic peptidase domain-containing protein [Strongyloides ratti]CEF61629.1 Reverse transcriptase domain and Integrase, catalytic core domain and Ribonuclease H-like domain and Peptidase A2A, retrovirus RVP subgroup domain and AT hook-like family and Aspartic peptidase domain-containing protein [Strongyloides ratti]